MNDDDNDNDQVQLTDNLYITSVYYPCPYNKEYKTGTMQLGRSQVSTLRPPPILSVDFNQDGRLFTVASETGYEVWRTWPLQLVRRRGQL